jgi:CubicO group peptidase (beta-lactamase class C family)
MRSLEKRLTSPEMELRVSGKEVCSQWNLGFQVFGRVEEGRGRRWRKWLEQSVAPREPNSSTGWGGVGVAGEHAVVADSDGGGIAGTIDCRGGRSRRR